MHSLKVELGVALDSEAHSSKREHAGRHQPLTHCALCMCGDAVAWRMRLGVPYRMASMCWLGACMPCNLRRQPRCRHVRAHNDRG